MGTVALFPFCRKLKHTEVKLLTHGYSAVSGKAEI